MDQRNTNKGVDLLRERGKLEAADPGLAGSYRKFADSFRQFKQVESDVRGGNQQATSAQPGTRLRA